MAVIIKTGLDTGGANQDTAKLQSSLKGEIGSALQSVQTKADEAQKSLKGMLDIQKVQVAIGALGPLKSIVDGVGVSMLGLSEQTAKAASKSLDMASQGAAVGAAFGPLGAVIGGVGGALLVYASASSEAAAAAKKTAQEASEAAKQVAAATAEAVQQFGYLGAIDLSGLISEISRLQKEANKLKIIPLQAQQDIQQLTDKALPKLIEGFERAANVAEGDEFKLQTKNIKEVTEAYNRQQDALEELSEKLRAQGKALKDNASSTAFSGQTLVSAEKDLKDLTTQVAEAQRESDAYKGAIDAYSASLTVSTPKVQAHAKAIDQQALAQKAFIDGIKAETEARLASIAAARERAADREAEGGGLDVAGMRELREESTAASQAALDAVDKLSLIREIELPIVQVESMATALDLVAERALALGATLQNALAEVGVGAANALFDNLEAGRKPLEGLGNAFAKLASQQLRAIGTTLIGEGLKNELKAASLLILSAGANPQGYALAGVGATEIAAGLAMGGAGALLGRRANKGASTSAPPDTGTSESLGSREAEAKGPQQLAPVKIYLGPEQGVAVFAGDQRGVAEYGRFNASAQAMAAKAPR